MKLRNSILQGMKSLKLCSLNANGWALCSFVLLGLMFALPSSAQDAQDTAEEPVTRMSPKLLWQLGRLGEAVTSPDGTQVAYTVRRYELSKNKGHSVLHVVNVADSKDTAVLKDWSSIGSLHWLSTKDGNRLFFEGTPASPDNKNKDGDEKLKDGEEKPEEPTNQAWSLDTSTGKAIMLTSVEDGIANLKVAPGGNEIGIYFGDQTRPGTD